jgi:prophage maintenance system killer protein
LINKTKQRGIFQLSSAWHLKLKIEADTAHLLTLSNPKCFAGPKARMSTVIYSATSETLEIAVEQIPHAPSRPKFAGVARSFVKHTNRWEVISEWWYPIAGQFLSYPPQNTTSLSLERALELNRFITNGVSIRSGEYKAIQSSSLSTEIFQQRYLMIPEACGAKQILKHAIENAVRLRADQVFHDGNHRTALLLIYEILAEHGLHLQAKPMSLYIIISNRSEISEHGHYTWKAVGERMYRHCKSRLKFVSAVPTSAERPVLFANAIKTLEFENSLLNQISQEWFATGAKHQAEERRSIARRYKCLNRGLYEQFYRLCVLGSWVGPPRVQIYEEASSMPRDQG